MTEWLDHVRDFIARHGTADSDKLYRHRLEHHKDERDGIFDVRVSADGVLSGTVLTPEMHTEALKLIETPVTQNNIKILIDENTPWALINRPVEDIRRNPSILAERISQARMGEAARVIEQREEWSLIRLEHDGYSGWVHNGALHLCAESEVRGYQSHCSAIVTVPLADVCDESNVLIQKIPFATLIRVPGILDSDTLVTQPPDRRIWSLRISDAIPLAQRPSATPEGIKQTLELIHRFCGVPYLWGGRTPYGFDCSGLAGTFYAFMGISIPRDADQQYDKGIVVEGTPEPGDLLFFGEKDEEDEVHISHVAISIGDEMFIHANGSDWGVSYNTFDPNSKLYRKWLHENYRGARRFR
jgi:cell wall-associated NlpC family hydrolase